MLRASSRSYSLLLWLGFAAVGTYFVMPLEKNLRRGIDLVGGFYLTLKVDTNEAVKNELSDRAGEITRGLRKGSLPEPKTKKVDRHGITFTFDNVNDVQLVDRYIRSKDKSLMLHQDGTTLRCTLSEVVASQIKNSAVESNIEILRKRLDATGVAEVGVTRQGNSDIIVELPNVDDPARAKGMIGNTAQLEIKRVEASGRSEDELLDKYDGIAPEGLEILEGYEDDGKNYYLVDEDTDITGKDLKDARPAIGGPTNAEPVVSFRFSPEGGNKFYELTSNNVGGRLAIILDGKVISAPSINVAIRSEGYIQGHFTQQSSKDLATMLKSGSYVAPVTFEEERRIGPSLGQEAITKGMNACLIALGMLFLFSLFYYRVAGLLAFIALLYNLLLIVFCLSWLQATLTLPGIAGMVLTVGMAIDASVLIYEKIRETLESGASFRKAVDVGFSDALVVILDGNITTFLMGMVLYYFGTGPIQGFAVTLMLGIVATLISGLFFLRALINFVLGFTKGRISI